MRLKGMAAALGAVLVLSACGNDASDDVAI